MAVQKIIIDNFLGGLAPSRYVGAPNQLDSYDTTSGGFDPFLGDDIGLLRRGMGQSTITGVTNITGDVQWMELYNRGNSYVYAYETQLSVANRIHRINSVTHAVDTTSPFPQSLPAFGDGTGLRFFTDYLYYAAGRYLGRYDLASTFNHSYNISLGTTCLGANIQHPMDQGNGKLFIGNSDRATNGACIAVDDGTTVNLKGLDLSKTGQLVKSLAFDKNVLFIASTANTSSGAQTIAPSTLYIWDTSSTGWQERYKFPEADFQNVRVTPQGILGFGGRGVYKLEGNGFSMLQEYAGGPDAYGVDTAPFGATYWVDENAQTFGYGSRNPQLESVVYKPINFDTNASGGLKWIDKNNLYVGGFQSGNRLRRYSISGTNYEANATYRIPMLKFPSTAKLVRVLVYSQPWPSGASVSVFWAKGDGSSTTSLGTISTASSERWSIAPNGLEGSSWQIGFTHALGNVATPKITQIVIEYEILKD